MQKKYIYNAILSDDFETRAADIVEVDRKNLDIHRVNYCMAQLVCEKCINLNDDDICQPSIKKYPIEHKIDVCVQRGFIFSRDSALKVFIDKVKIFKNLYCKLIRVAHNAKSFDANLCIKEISNRQVGRVDTIITGTKITLIKF